MSTQEKIFLGRWTGQLGMGLAMRELQCVLGIATGLTSKELARDLGIQPESVKKRVLSAGTKLGVTRRAALVAEALRRGIIAPLALALVAVLIGQHQQPTLTRRPETPRRIEMRVAARRDAAEWVA